MQLRNIIAVAALGGLASAANNSTLTNATPSVDSGCSFSSFTATAAGQLQSVAACETAVGDVVVYGDSFRSIELTGLKQLYGNLAIRNASQATVVNAPTLQLVSGQLEVSGGTILSNLNLAQLTTVGSLEFNALPALEHTGLTAGLTSADSIVISDTGLSQLTGINVYKLKVFNVNNNKDIDTIDSGLQEVTDTLDISYNAEKVDVILNQLKSANNIILQQINSFQAPNLTSTNGSIAISKSSIEKIELPKVESAGSVVINQNDDLEEIDFSKLTSLSGALQISDNDNLKSLDGFNSLKTVGGTININGSFDNGTFDALSRVSGGFILKTDGQLSCSAFNKLNSNGDVRGDKFQCEDKVTTSSSSSAKSNSGSSSNSATGGSSQSSEGGSSSSGSSSSSRKSEGSSNVGKLASVVAAFAGIGFVLI
ncbi:uncharacterized protein LODBEIA_P28810 [Lodderomyces beijingensis]|uniref:Receptor L-domain domain-containing protein n=1 Tax=Lodderomyces beijingensis TaxID=1775926 RepID=A0ABP0ZR01_9ASCO